MFLASVFNRVQRRTLALSIVIFLAVQAACGDPSNDLPEPVPYSTPGPYFGAYTHLSPAFEPLSGATAHYGELNGGVYQIEVPEDWNGDLVIYFKGSNRFSRELFAVAPPLREHFISLGYAWAATSYNRNLVISGDEAQQAAVLWDYFAEHFGRPGKTFAAADSAGGDGALVAVERYAERFDGALVACGVSGVFPEYDLSADLLAAGAYAAGVTQTEFDAGPVSEIVETQIVGAINNDALVREKFLSIWEHLTGGERPFFVEGYELRQDIWSLAIEDVRVGTADNMGRVYELGGTGVDEEDFNRRAIRIARDPSRSADPGDPTGKINAPVILIHTSGDGIAPLSYAQHNAERIQTQGNGDLLRVRVFGNAYHCGFTFKEGTDAFDTLVTWVVEGEEPSASYGADFPRY